MQSPIYFKTMHYASTENLESESGKLVPGVPIKRSPTSLWKNSSAKLKIKQTNHCLF